MIPIGYLYKRVVLRPDWLAAEKVCDIYSASGCISHNFADYIKFWKHNGYWLFDSPGILAQLASEQNLDLGGQTLFYYEAYEYEFDDKSSSWVKFEPVPGFQTEIVMPTEKHLHGFDVSTFSCGNKPECSPLSCNYLAKKLAVNSHCLFDTFEDAKDALVRGEFQDSEPGPYRILAVYTL